MTNKTGEIGPVYDVELIDTLPLQGSMLQAMPNRADLIRVRKVNERTAAGYEVLLRHWHKTSNSVEVEELKTRVEANEAIRQRFRDVIPNLCVGSWEEIWERVRAKFKDEVKVLK